MTKEAGRHVVNHAPTLTRMEPEPQPAGEQPTEPQPAGEQPAEETPAAAAAEDEPAAVEDEPLQRWRGPVTVGLGVAVLALSLLVGPLTWNFSRGHHPPASQAAGTRPARARPTAWGPQAHVTAARPLTAGTAQRCTAARTSRPRSSGSARR